MKIEYIEGDLFSTNCLHILHGCNAQGVMGSGVAKIVRDRYTAAYDFYVAKHAADGLKLGDVQFLPVNDKIIINAITQEFYGRDGKLYVDYDAVATVMKTVNRVLKLAEYTKVAMPKIGAGLGGGDWNIIAAIIEQEMTDVSPIVYVQ